MISVDLIIDLSLSQGHNSILIIINHGCSKVAVFLSCQKTIDFLEIAMLYAERVFSFYGVPKQVISDRDPQFTAQFAKELCNALKIN